MSKLVKPNEACKILRISRPTLEKAIKNGQVTAVRVGTMWRIALPEVAASAHQPEAA